MFLNPTPLVISLAIILSTSTQVLAAPCGSSHSRILARSNEIEYYEQRHAHGPMHVASMPAQASTVTVKAIESVKTITVIPTPVRTPMPSHMQFLPPPSMPFPDGTRKPVDTKISSTTTSPSSLPSATTSETTAETKTSSTAIPASSTASSSAAAIASSAASSSAASTAASTTSPTTSPTASSTASSTTSVKASNAAAASTTSASVIVVALPSSSLTITVPDATSVTIPAIATPTLPSILTIEDDTASEILSVLGTSINKLTGTVTTMTTTSGTTNSDADATEADSTQQSAATTTTTAATSTCTTGTSRKCCSAVHSNLKNAVNALDGITGFDLNFLSSDTSVGLDCKDIDENDTAEDGAVCWDVVSCCENTAISSLSSIFVGCVPVV